MIRICTDPRYINENLKWEHFAMQKKEEIKAELTEATSFTKLDANAGFHRIPLDNDTSWMCTFRTPFVGCSYRRFPFDISYVLEVFQRIMT